MKGSVGSLRQQTALAHADMPIQLVSKDPEIARLIANLRVVKVYPDTTDAQGNFTSTFKIEVEKG